MRLFVYPVKIMPFRLRESATMFTTGFLAFYADYKDGFVVLKSTVKYQLA
jgi:hypothetical protein